MHGIIFYTTFVASNKIARKMIKEITEQENELIEAVRNFQRAYPNGQKELRRFARRIFEQMIYR